MLLVCKMEADIDELSILDFITDFEVEDLISLTTKKGYLCPHCGKLLSGLTSYQRHLVLFKYTLLERAFCILNLVFSLDFKL